jgi:hypothetical protein
MIYQINRILDVNWRTYIKKTEILVDNFSNILYCKLFKDITGLKF